MNRIKPGSWPLKMLLPLFGFLSCLQADPAGPSLGDIASKVKSMPGVEIEAEMVSPSVIPITFRIATDGFFYAKYPTSEQYTDLTHQTTYLADRREYTTTPSPSGNPLPVGFNALWPTQSDVYRQVGPTTESTFHDWTCYQIPCQGDSEYTITLFVEQGTLMPRGSRVNLNGTLYEIVYRAVRVAAQDREQVTFVASDDARPAGEFDPLASLVKAGTSLHQVTGRDASGRMLSLAELIGPSGKGAVLNFWFSSCTGCVREMPYLVKLHPHLKEQGVALVGVNAIDKSEIAQRTSDKNALPYPTIIGKDAVALAQQAGIRAYPVTLILNQDLQVVDAVMGFDASRIGKALNSLGVQLPATME